MNRFTKFFVGVVAALAIFAFASSASAAYTHAGLLKQGMTSSQVHSLQETLNSNGFLVSTVGAGSPGMESNYFGGKTKAAVMAFQTAKGLKADGVVGVQTGTALAALTGGSVSYPAGCSSTSGYSTTTGQPCSSSANLPAGCTSNSGYSTTTGQSCAGTVTLPAGCTSTSGYSSTTGQKCDSTGSNNNGPLQGGAGTLSASKTTADVKTSLNQGGMNDKVAGARLQAQGSDLSLSSVQVEFELTGGTSASDRIDRYVGDVSVWLGDQKVGSANISQFFREGNPYTYSYSIPLSGAVVRQGQSADLYVAVNSNSVISGSSSSGDLSAKVTAYMTSFRYTDATGAVLSYGTSSVSSEFGYTSGYGAQASIVDSGSPKADSVEVNETNTSASIKLLAAKIKNDSSATSSVKVNRITTNLAVTGAGSATNIDNVVNAVTISINGTSYNATKSSSTTGALTSGAGNANYVVEINNGIMLNAGQSADIAVWATFRGVTNNYTDGAKVTASIATDAVDAETSNADASVSGAVTGSAMTLNSGKVASYKGGVYLAPVMSSDGTTTITNGYIGVTFEAGKNLNSVTYTAPGTSTPGAGKIVYSLSGVTAGSTVSVYKGEGINSSEKLTAGTDKFYEGTKYTLVVDITEVSGGQNVPTIEITNIDQKTVSNIKFSK